MLNDKLMKLAKNIVSAQFDANFNDYQSAPTEEEFYELAESVRKMIPPKIPISDDEYEKILVELRQTIGVRMLGNEFVLEDETTEHEKWLDDAKSDIDWFFWTRYEKYLRQDKLWNDNLISALDETSDKILDLTGNPRSDKPFSRRGLIMGNVQSGKTANYTALCNKATDAGYNVIIVLTGMLEDLRRQTQYRLDTEFAGRRSNLFLDSSKSKAIKNTPIGVANYGDERRISQFTSTESDFSREVLKSNSLNLLDVSTTVLFVVKKNKSRLDSLINWLEQSRLDGQKYIKQSLLLIDDEADNASINTNDPDDDPTAINGCIRRILTLFYQTTYIGITATPFANIFISPDSDDEMLGDDLFPRDFIYALDVPDNYIGPDKVFGEETNRMLVPVNPIAPDTAPEVENYFPKRHKSNLTVNALPSGLYDALNYFLLVNAVLDFRKMTSTHRTMLIHVSRFTNVQSKIYALVARWLNQVKENVRGYHRLRADEADQNSPSIAALHDVFNRFELEQIGNVTWEVLLKDYLFDAIKSITVGLRNSSGEHSFDYRNEPDGLRVIAIGGNSFSRGLTLEGLCVTYFYRNSGMYDTLMQMGRWFGFRPGYDDLCRLWTTEELIDCYSFINEASNELIGDIKTMQTLGKTPKDFGLRVRRSPDALMITARNKMRSGTTIRQAISLSRQFLETTRLVRNKKVLNGNRDLIRAFVDEINRNAVFDESSGRPFWNGVDKKLVAKLIADFKISPWHFSFQGDAISEYILNQTDDKTWDVMIAEGDGELCDQLSGVRSFNMINRQIFVNDNEIMIGGKNLRIGTGGLVRFGLSDEQIKAARDAYYNRTGKKRGSFIPEKDYMIKGRNPILFLYVIDIKKAQRVADIPNILFALGVGLPDTGGTAQTVEYVINSVEYNKKVSDLDAEDIEE